MNTAENTFKILLAKNKAHICSARLLTKKETDLQPGQRVRPTPETTSICVKFNGISDNHELGLKVTKTHLLGRIGKIQEIFQIDRISETDSEGLFHQDQKLCIVEMEESFPRKLVLPLDKLEKVDQQYPSTHLVF